MHKRDFLKHLLGGSAALALDLPTWLAAKPVPGRHYVWAHTRPDWDRDRWQRELEHLQKVGFRGVMMGGSPETLAMVVQAAQAVEMEVHAWTWTLNQPGEVDLRTSHPEYFSLSRSGKSCASDPPYVDYYRWLCPSREPVRALLREKMDRLARVEGLSSIHLDYVRHPDVILPIALQPKYELVQDQEYPDFDFCYCEVCRERFMAQGGEDPMQMDDPTQDEAWRAYRWQAVSEVVGEIAEVVHARGLDLTAAVFPTPRLARQLVRQAWDTWPLQGVYPMLYQNFYNEDLRWIRESVRAGRRALTDGQDLFAGLFLPALPPEDLGRAIRLARKGGASGVSLFDLKGISDAHWPVIQAAFADWA
ncbi:MAG: hypothetical protein D6722_26505 [Bacteroidetes bacterium]|nr:MAG: hypothetical protein D6722_26505 [Bacteroidota bacterium]